MPRGFSKSLRGTGQPGNRLGEGSPPQTRALGLSTGSDPASDAQAPTKIAMHRTSALDCSASLADAIGSPTLLRRLRAISAAAVVLGGWLAASPALAQEEAVEPEPDSANSPAALPALLPAPAREVGLAEVTVDEYLTVSISAQNAYITDILQKLAIQTQRSIVPSARVERLVTANIHRMPFEDALQGLLHPNGLGSLQQGEFLFVYTQEELQAKGIGGFGMGSRVFHLDYMRPEDAKDFVTGMLSPSGSVAFTKDLTDSGAGGASAGVSQLDTDFYDPDTDRYDLRNAIVVHDTPDRLDQIEAFLDQIDLRPQQVLIEATIIQTRVTENNEFGVDFAILGDQDFGEFFTAPTGGNTLDFGPQLDDQGLPIAGSVVQPTNNSLFVQSTPGNTSGPASLKLGYVDNIGIFLRALDEVTDVTLLSNPKVIALNRQRSKVFVGKRFGFFETTIVENQVQQSRRTVDTGITLDVRPHILEDGRIRLELAPKVSDVAFRPINGVEGEATVLDELVQSLTTDILIPEGHTAVLGGLFREDTNRTRTQVPFLGDLPLVGGLFQGRRDQIQKDEIIFLIKPTIMDDNRLQAMGEAGLQMFDDVRLGSRVGLLPWSRERQTGFLNLEAQNWLAVGDYSMARWCLRRSIGMHPAQPEVIRAMEEITGKPLWNEDQSLLKAYVAGELEAMNEPTPSEELEEPVDSETEQGEGEQS